MVDIVEEPLREVLELPDGQTEPLPGLVGHAKTRGDHGRGDDRVPEGGVGTDAPGHGLEEAAALVGQPEDAGRERGRRGVREPVVDARCRHLCPVLLPPGGGHFAQLRVDPVRMVGKRVDHVPPLLPLLRVGVEQATRVDQGGEGGSDHGKIRRGVAEVVAGLALEGRGGLEEGLPVVAHCAYCR